MQRDHQYLEMRCASAAAAASEAQTHCLQYASWAQSRWLLGRVALAFGQGRTGEAAVGRLKLQAGGELKLLVEAACQRDGVRGGVGFLRFAVGS
jgi:hypothetical protein